MNKALLKDTIKEIKNTYKRFISILLMAFLGVGFFAGIRASSPDMIDTIDKYYKDQNVYDIQILSTMGLTSNDVEALEKIENVECVQESFEVDGKIEIENKEIIAKIINIGDVNKPVLLEGELPKNEAECLVEKDFLIANNKKIGDIIKVEIEELTNYNGEKVAFLKQKEMKIVGITKSPLYISRDRGNSNLGAGKINYYIYIPQENIFTKDIYTSIYIKVKDAQKYKTSTEKYENYIETVKSNIEGIAEKEDAKWYVLDRNANSGYVGFIQDSKSIENIGKVFPVVFFIVATLISLTSMTRMVEEQRLQIGTLKALGYNKLQIMNKYVIYASLACIIGGILGMSVGFIALPKILWLLYSMLYEMTDIVISFNWAYGGIGLALIFICIVGATVYATIKELIQEPAVLMRPKPPKIGNRVILEKIPFVWKRLNFSNKVTVRNLFRYKKRFYMTIVGILGCTALILTGFGIKDSVTRLIPDQFGKIFVYDMQINLKDNVGLQEKEEFIKLLGEKDQIQKIVKVYMSAVSMKNGENSENAQMVVAEENFNDVINIVDINKNEKVELKENEICITDKVAQLLGVKEGDNIFLKNDDKDIEIKISNIVENYVSHYIFMSKQTYENIFKEKYKTNVLLTKNIELTEEEQENLAKEIMDKSEVAGITNITSTVKPISDMMSSLNYVVIILIVSAGLLAFVVLYNLSNVNISERIRELATIKVLGFYDKEVYRYVARETIILTVIGIVLGLIFGYLLNYYIMQTCEISILRFTKKINPISYVYAIIITVGFTVIVNIATYFALKKINMIESLKSVE